MQTVQIRGTDKQLYRLVAPLVMDPEVLKANNNYPFKTSDKFVWFVAVKGKEVVGFIPVEERGSTAVINNYYVKKEPEEVLGQLLSDVLTVFIEKKTLAAIVQVEHRQAFEKKGFVVEKTWKRYVKMWRYE